MKGFTVIQENDVPSKCGKATFLKHDRTGMNIFHFATESDRREFFFSFRFKTPILDNKGVAHVLEHSILRGSRKYPIKDPVAEYSKFSPNIGYNAQTECFNTAFFANTCCEKDFYNLLDIYGDAVFFPLLKEEAILTEGWHLELDKDNKPFINGIVFNEMNIPRANLGYYANNEFKKHFDVGTELNIIGGYSGNIVDLTYDDVKKFHEKYYTPANCLLTLVGSIPLDEELEFLEENLLSNLPSGTEEMEIKRTFVPVKKNQKIKFPHYDEEPSHKVEYVVFLPEMSEPQERIIVNYLTLVDDYLDRNKIANPFGAVQGIAYDSEYGHRSVSFIMKHLKKKDISKAKKYAKEFLRNLFANEIPFEDIKALSDLYDSGVMTVDRDYELTEIEEIASTGWTKYGNPNHFFERSLKEQLRIEREAIFKNEGNDVREMVRKLVCEDYLCDYTFEGPADKNLLKACNKDVEKKLKAKLRQCSRQYSNDQIRETCGRIESFNNSDEQEEIKKLPRIRISDLDFNEDFEEPVIENVKTSNGEVKLISFVQDMDNSTFFKVRYNIDDLNPEQNQALVYYIKTHNNIGTGNMSNEENTAYLEKEGVVSLSMGISYTPCAGDASLGDLRNHRWLVVDFKIRNNGLKNAKKLLSDFIFHPNFESGTDFGMNCRFFEMEKGGMKQEGIYTFENLDNYMKGLLNKGTDEYNQRTGYLNQQIFDTVMTSSLKDLCESAKKELPSVLSGQACGSVVASQENMEEAKNVLREFFVENGNTGVAPSSNKSVLYEKPLGERVYSGLYRNVSNTVCVYIPMSPYPSKECTAEYLVMRWLNDSELYRNLRLKTGAYQFSVETFVPEMLAVICVGKTQVPKDSVGIIHETLESIRNYEFSEEELESMIIKFYGAAMIPHIPSVKVDMAMQSQFSHFTVENRRERTKNIQEMTTEDLHNAAVRICEWMKDSRSLIITNDPSQLDGKVLYDWRKMN